MSTLADVRAGDLVFGPIGGKTGAAIGAGEVLLAPWKTQLSWKTWWRVRHCGTIVQAASPGFYLGSVSGASGIGPIMAQAEPHGYESIELGREHWTADWTYIRPNYGAHASVLDAIVGTSQVDRVVQMAAAMVRAKIPYAFEDYAAIAAHRAHLPVPHLDEFISATYLDHLSGLVLPKRSMCSQGVDFQLTHGAGWTVFEGKLPQDVDPAELYLRMLDMHPMMVIRPGVTDMVASESGISLRAIPAHML